MFYIKPPFSLSVQALLQAKRPHITADNVQWLTSKMMINEYRLYFWQTCEKKNSQSNQCLFVFFLNRYLLALQGYDHVGEHHHDPAAVPLHQHLCLHKQIKECICGEKEKKSERWEEEEEEDSFILCIEVGGMLHKDLVDVEEFDHLWLGHHQSFLNDMNIDVGNDDLRERRGVRKKWREIKRRISQHTSTWMVEVCAKTSQVMERVVRRASKVCHSSVCPGRWLIQATERTSEKKWTTTKHSWEIILQMMCLVEIHWDLQQQQMKQEEVLMEDVEGGEEEGDEAPEPGEMTLQMMKCL